MNDEQEIFKRYKLINEIFDDSSHPNPNNKFYKICHLNDISDIPLEEIDAYEARLANHMFSYALKTYPEFVKILFDRNKNESESSIINRFFKDMQALGEWYYSKYPEIVDDLDNKYQNLSHALPSPNDANCIENYPLFISLYDENKVEYGLAWGGEEYADHVKLINSKQISNPNQRESAAKYLWNEANKHQDPFKGQAIIVMEKEKNGYGNKKHDVERF